MLYSNINGTIDPSFKIGKDGITILNKAVQSGQDTVKRLAIHDPTSATDETIAYKSEIPSKYIKEITQDQTTGTATIVMNDGSTIVLNSGSISGPKATVVGDLAVFGSTDGRKLDDSSTSISKDMADDKLDKDKTVPTTSAVLSYVGKLESLLEARLNGNLK